VPLKEYPLVVHLYTVFVPAFTVRVHFVLLTFLYPEGHLPFIGFTLRLQVFLEDASLYLLGHVLIVDLLAVMVRVHFAVTLVP